MAKTVVVVGYGPGISAAVAEKFGSQGFQVALVGRTADRLDAGVQALAAKGITARAYPADAGDADAVRAVITNVRSSLAPITVIHWNAYSGAAGDLLQADTKAIHAALDVATAGLLAAVQAALPDLRAAKDGAVLVTNGGLGYFDAGVDAMAVQWNSMGLAVANAAKHKIVGLLAQKLKPEGVHVGEVMVLGIVKGTAFDRGQATIDPAAVASRFWALYENRSEVTVEAK